MQSVASHRKGRQAGTMVLLALGLLVAGCSDHERAVPQVSSSCLGVSYPADTELTILGTLEGDRINVRGGWFTRPQVIVISSYQKIVWDFSRFPADKLRGVIASGLERPEIVGVAAGTPVRTVMDYESLPNCGNEFLVYHGGPALDRLVTTMEKMTKLTATRFRGSYHATAFDAGSNGAQEAVVDREHHPIDEQRTPQALQPLVAQGLIRPATQADVDAYNAKLTAMLKTRNLAAYAVDDLRYWQSYVVLAKVTVPQVSGGYLGRFIVPSGVPRLGDQGRWNSFYFIETGKCTAVSGVCPGTAGWRIALHGEHSRGGQHAAEAGSWDDTADLLDEPVDPNRDEARANVEE